MPPQPFAYDGVALDEGPLRCRFEQAHEFYRRIPNDDLLRGFRARAGRPAPGVELGGWYSRDNGNIFGQVLSALSRIYAVTRDDDCRAKLATLVAEWGRCLGSDGYSFYSYKTTGMAYTFDKLVGGLVDAYLYADIAEAPGYLARLTDWGIANLDRTRAYANADGEGRPNVAGSEWYTLAENLYRAFLATGNEKYREFAELWEYPEFWNQIARGDNVWAPRSTGRAVACYHAYSHVNSFASAAAAYQVKGDPRYLDALQAAYDFVQAQCFATGGYGPNESLLPPERFVPLLAETKNHFETQCGTWAAFKLAKYLIGFTGDAKYGDWIERLIYNAIRASLPISDDGRVFYYASYRLEGGYKERYDDRWACCSGTYPLAITDCHDLVYFTAPARLYVNLYTPSTVEWQCGESLVTLSQQTRFPEAEHTDFVLIAEPPTEFALELRVPGWLAGPMRVTVNGQPFSGGPDSRHWLTIHRTWRTGDTVSVMLPMGFATCPIVAGRTYPAAIRRGPVVLAIRAPEGSPHGRVNLAELEQDLVPSAGEPLIYHVRSDPALLVQPYYAFREREPYFMYLDPSQARER